MKILLFPLKALWWMIKLPFKILGWIFKNSGTSDWKSGT